MKKRHTQLLLTSVVLLTSLQFALKTNVDAKVGETTAANWLDASPSSIQGMPPALRMLPAHPHYRHYKAQVGGNREPLVFIQAYKTEQVFYTPLASGHSMRYSNIWKPEQLHRNNNASNPTNPNQWTNNRHVQAANHLLDRSKNHHVKKFMFDHSLQGANKGFLRYGVKNSNNLIETGDFSGKKGEFRQLGYSESGGIIYNNDFPNEHYRSNEYFSDPGYNFANYDFQVKPWMNKDTIPYRRVNGGTRYDFAATNTNNWKIKHAAMVRFLNERPNYTRKSNNVSYWMDRHSLQNDPSGGENAYFIAASPDGYYYHASTDSMPYAAKNLTLTRQRVVDAKGNVIRTFTRKAGEEGGTLTAQRRQLVSGEKVTIETTISNTSRKGARTTTTLNPTVNVGYKTGNSALTEAFYFDSKSMDSSSKVKHNKKLAVGEQAVMRKEIVVPFNSDKMGVYGEIDMEHFYLRDNTLLSDDFSHLTLAVDNEAGNLRNESIKLIGKDGKAVSKPIPGHEYKVQFGFKYVAQRNAQRNVTVNVDYLITRQLPFKGKDTQKKTLQMKNFKPVAGRTYTLTSSDFVVYETGVFDVESVLSVVGNQNYNQNTSDDNQKTQFKDTYDLSVRNVQLIPKEVSHTDRGTMTYLLKADVDYNVPSHVKDHAKDVTFRANVGGTEQTFKRHIKQGFNPNVTMEVAIPSNGRSRVISATMLVNSDNYVYESNTNNNRGTATATVKNEAKVVPYKGAITNKANWRQHLQIHEWTSQTVRYKGFNSGANFSFPRYTSKGKATNSQVNLSESYTIDHVWFKSKTTTDLKEGPKRDGWVDLMKEPGKIKAGYGYELQVDVSYETDAFSKVPKETSTKWVRPGITKPMLSNNLYIQTPDNTVHSVNGDGGTSNTLNFKRRNVSDGKTTWTFEIAPRRTLGVDTLGKFFIGEDVANGTYDMTVFTPKTAGLLGKMTSESTVVNTLLFDQKDRLKIEVVGSATDDITDHITQ